MSVQQTVKYISLRDIVVPTTEGYAIRFTANEPVEVPNFKRVIAAVNAAGCIPFEEAMGLGKIQVKSIEQVKNEEISERQAMIIDGIGKLKDRDNPIDFNRSGAPQTRSLEAVTGLEKISNAERDKAWEVFKARDKE